MDLFQAFILGMIQGITEFLPISSSGHLVLAEEFFGLKTHTLKSFDVALHIATLLAICIYFRKDVIGLIKAFFKFISGRLAKDDEYGKLILYIVVGTIPAILFGFFAGDLIDSIFRNVKGVAVMLALIAVVFIIGEKIHTKMPKREIGLKQAIIIGFAQALAIIPGVSRSGSSIVAGLFQGIERSAAARFSFLLGIPAMLGAALLTTLSSDGEFAVEGGPMIVGFISSFVFGIASVAGLMHFLKKHTLISFAAYRLVLVAAIVLNFL